MCIRDREYISSLDKYEIVSSFESSFEIMPKETSKGMAVKRVCEYYNIDRSQVIAFGDNENDRSMIEFAGLGVAMENGCLLYTSPHTESCSLDARA